MTDSPRFSKQGAGTSAHWRRCVFDSDDSVIVNAKVQVPLALASIADRIPNDPAGEKARTEIVNELKKGTSPQYWSDQIEWSGRPYFQNDSDRDVHLAAQNILALGSMHNEAARDFICKLRHSSQVTSQPILAEAVNVACSQSSCTK